MMWYLVKHKMDVFIAWYLIKYRYDFTFTSTYGKDKLSNQLIKLFHSSGSWW